MKQKPELLAPAGNFPMLVAAVKAGADAVYFGLKEGMNMRANARNFSIKDLPKMKEICSSPGKRVKMYLTLNTIIYDKEVKDVEKIIKKSKPFIDAIICWDLSVIRLCKKYKIPFHVSTQASISNSESAKFYKELSAERIVLARELNLKQIKEISKVLPIEVFIHGAMCVSISGRCFTSQFLFNKSANRGECIHPCRRSYIVKDKQEGYELEVKNDKVMSAKDLCALPFIEQLKKAGITSFKIEGRNRDPRYVDTVVRVYRKAIDKKLTKQEIEKSMQELKSVYNRSFSSGFLIHLPTSDDFARVEHSAATHKKIFIGKVSHFYPKPKVATFILKDSLKIGDEICVIGNTTGIENLPITSIEKKNKQVDKVKKGDEIGIFVPFKIRKNDEVYKIIESVK